METSMAITDLPQVCLALHLALRAVAQKHISSQHFAALFASHVGLIATSLLRCAEQPARTALVLASTTAFAHGALVHPPR